MHNLKEWDVMVEVCLYSLCISLSVSVFCAESLGLSLLMMFTVLFFFCHAKQKKMQAMPRYDIETIHLFCVLFTYMYTLSEKKDTKAK